VETLLMTSGAVLIVIVFLAVAIGVTLVMTVQQRRR